MIIALITARGAVSQPMQKGRPGPGRGHRGLKAAGAEMLAPAATAPAGTAAVDADAVCPAEKPKPQGVGVQQPDRAQTLANPGTAPNVSMAQLIFTS